MLPQVIPAFYSQDYVPAVIGNFGLILEGNYDPNQMWFPFMQGCVIKAPAPVDPSLHRYRQKPAHIAGRQPQGGPWARIKSECRQPFIYAKGIEQYPLPFREARNLSKKEHHRIHLAGYPTWDRIKDQPIVVPILPEHAGQVKRWCDENCQGRYHVKQRALYLQSEADVVMATILWRNGSK